MTGTVLDHIFLLRIPLLAPVWTILILGWITGRAGPGLRTGAVGDFLSAGCSPLLWLALSGFSLVVASIYIVNQIVDIESDRINGKLFLLPRGLVRKPAAWTIATLCAAGGMAVAVTQGPGLTALFALGLALGAVYNLPPLALKNRPWGGVAANLIGHGVLTYLVGWYAAHLAEDAGTVWWPAGLLSALSPGFANAAVFLATTIPDAEGDRRVGKRTFAVAYGPGRTAALAAVLCALALGTSFLMEHNGWVMTAPAAVSVVLFAWFARSPRRETAFAVFKWPVFLLSLTVACLVPAYGLLIVVTFFGSRWYYRTRFGIEYPTFKAQ